MTKEEAIKLLDTGSSHERLKAARFLADNPEIENIIALRKARRKDGRKAREEEGRSKKKKKEE